MPPSLSRQCLHARQRSVTPRQTNLRFSLRQHACFHQLTSMETSFTRFESARLLSLGYLARTCLRRKAWTVCKPQRSSECYQRQMAWCQWSDSEKSYFAVEKAFSSSGKAEWRTYSAHFLLISWLMITVTFLCTSNDEWWTACKHCFTTCNTISLYHG